jgi:hypothetical protein
MDYTIQEREKQTQDIVFYKCLIGHSIYIIIIIATTIIIIHLLLPPFSPMFPEKGNLSTYHY